MRINVLLQKSKLLKKRINLPKITPLYFKVTHKKIKEVII
jgi:hypothetical protein